MNLNLVDKYVLHAIFESLYKYNFKALILTCKSINIAFKEYTDKVAKRLNCSSVSKLYIHQLMIEKWIVKYIESNRSFNIGLCVDMSIGKTILGLTACLINNNKYKDGYSIYVTSCNSFNELVHECKKHFPAEVKSKKLMVVKSNLVAYEQVQDALIREEWKQLAGKVICVNINTVFNMHKNLLERANFAVVDECHKTKDMINHIVDKVDRICLMTATPCDVLYRCLDVYFETGKILKKPTIIYDIILDEHFPNNIAEYSDKHKIFVTTNCYMLDRILTNHKLDHYYDFRNRSTKVREAFGFGGGLLCSTFKKISEGQNMNECSLMFIHGLHKIPLKSIKQCIGRVNRSSNMHKQVRIVFLINRTDTTAWVRCKLASLGHYSTDTNMPFDKFSIESLSKIIKDFNRDEIIDLFTNYTVKKMLKLQGKQSLNEMFQKFEL